MPIELPIYARSSKKLVDPYALATPTTSWGGIVGYILGIFLVIMVILLIINYTITPIFRLYPGGPGYIPIPGGDSSQVYWKQGSGKPSTFSPFFDISTNVVAAPFQWSFALDIDITNPMHVSQSPRVLFYRGPPRFGVSGEFTPGAPTTIQGLIGNYNVAFALLPDTTDLVVSVLTGNATNPNAENVILQNVPVQTPFRVGVTISDTAMEVYLNGMLQRTRTFTPGATPINITGMFYPPQGINAEIAKVANLHLWSSVISASQMRYASPGLMTVKPSEKTDIPTSSCGSGSGSGTEQAIDSSLSSWSSTFQTNLGSMSSSIQSSVNNTSSAIQSSMSTTPSTTSTTSTTTTMTTIPS